MDKSDYVIEIVRTVLSHNLSDDEVLSCMIALHLYCIKVPEVVSIDNAGAERILSPLTRKHCAETVAEALKGESEPRDCSDYWYTQYDLRTPFEVVADIQGAWSEKVQRMMQLMKQTGLVSELFEE